MSGKSRPFGVARSAWPERPTRCSAVAIERGEPSRHVRSTVAHVDAQLERRGGDHQRELARLEALLGVEAALAAQAAVVRGDPLGPEAIGQVAGDALDEPPGVDEHQRGSVLAGESRDPVVDLLPLLVGAHRAQLVAQHLDGQVHVAALAHVDDLGQRPRGAHQQARRGLDGAHGGGETDPLQAAAPARDHQLLQPLQREREVGAALVARHRVDLVHDHGAHLGEPGPARLRGEQDEERLRRGHQHVGRPAADRAPLVGRRVAGAHRGPDAGAGQAGATAAFDSSPSGSSRLRRTSLESALSGET